VRYPITDGEAYQTPKFLSITMVLCRRARRPCHVSIRWFWRSRRGSLWRADAAIIPRLVQPNPTAGSAVNGSHQRPLGRAQGQTII